MSALSELKQAKAAAMKLLDGRLGTAPEWTLFRFLDRAIESLEEETAARAASAVAYHAGATSHNVVTWPPIKGAPSYADLAMAAIKEAGHPVATSDLLTFIGKHRELGDDAEKVKVSITSTLSKHAAIESVPWRGGKGWWIKGAPRAVPAADLETSSKNDEASPAEAEEAP